MSREIKFRVWDKENNSMILSESMVALMWTQGDEPNWIHYNLGSGIEQIHYSNFELMQFTGLQDKNGKDIYEGDVFWISGYEKILGEKGEMQTRFVVGAGFAIVHFFPTLAQFDLDSRALGTGLWELCNSGSGEVIGNIFEKDNINFEKDGIKVVKGRLCDE